MSMILLKLPTRERPQRFSRALWSYLFRAEDPSNIRVIVSMDEDDKENAGIIQAELSTYLTEAKIHVPPLGKRVNKIEAVNRDIPSQGWDILVVASDDMMCVEQGWDKIIRDDMARLHPGGDGCLWYNDAYTGGRICTLPIMDHQYYSRFGFVYAPQYISVKADNEQTEVAQKLGRITYDPRILFRHEHPINNAAVEPDALHHKNEGYFGRDSLTYETRKLAGFHLNGLTPAITKMYSQSDEQQRIKDYFGEMKGCVLDIGANDGTLFSNSRACIERGWKGVLVEPGEKAFDRLLILHAERAAKGQVVVINAAVTEADGEIPFFEGGAHLNKGDVGLLSTLSSSEKERWAVHGNTYTDTTVEGVSFETLRKKIPDHFGSMDLISIDAEGSDWMILQQMDLNTLGCKMIIVESNAGEDKRIIDYCKQFGFTSQARTAENLIFIR